MPDPTLLSEGPSPVQQAGQEHAQSNRVGAGYDALQRDPTRAPEFGLNPAAFMPGAQQEQPDPHDAKFDHNPSGAAVHQDDASHWILRQAMTLGPEAYRRVRDAGLHLVDQGADALNAGIDYEEKSGQKFMNEGFSERNKDLLRGMPGKLATIGQVAYAATQPEAFISSTVAQAVGRKLVKQIDPEGKHPVLGQVAELASSALGAGLGGAAFGPGAATGGAAVEGEMPEGEPTLKPKVDESEKGAEAAAGARNATGDVETEEMANSAWARAGGDQERFKQVLYQDAHNAGREDVIAHLESKMSPEEVADLMAYTGRPAHTEAEKTATGENMTEEQYAEYLKTGGMKRGTGEAGSFQGAFNEKPGAEQPGPENAQPGKAAAGGGGSGEKPPTGEAASAAAPEPTGPNVGDHVAYYQAKLDQINDPKFRAEYTRQNQTVLDSFMKGSTAAKDPEFQAHVLNLKSGEVANAEDTAGQMVMAADARATQKVLAQQYMEAHAQFGEGSPEAQEAFARLLAHDAGYASVIGLRGEGFAAETGRALEMQRSQQAEQMRGATADAAKNYNTYRKSGDAAGYASAVIAASDPVAAHAQGSASKLLDEPKTAGWMHRLIVRGMLSGGPAGPFRKVMAVTMLNGNRLASSYLAEQYENMFHADNPALPRGTTRNMARAYYNSLYDQGRLSLRTMTGDTKASKEAADMTYKSAGWGHEDVETEVEPTNTPRSIMSRAVSAIGHVDENTWRAASDADKISTFNMNVARYAGIEAQRTVAQMQRSGGVTPENAADLYQELVEKGTKNPSAWVLKQAEQQGRIGSFVNTPDSKMYKAVDNVLKAGTANVPYLNWEIPYARILSGGWFFRTKTNVMARGIDQSPFGFLTAYMKNAKWADANPNEASQWRDPEFTTNMFMAAIPSALAGMFALAHHENLITGGGPRDSKENADWSRTHIKYGIYLPQWMSDLIHEKKDSPQIGFSYQYFNELCPILGMLADTMDLAPDAVAHGSGSGDAVMKASLEVLSRAADNMPLVGGMYHTMDVIARSAVKGDYMSIANLYGREMVPAFLKSTGLWEKFHDALAAHNLEKDQDYKKYNSFGEKLYAGQGYTSEETPGRWMRFANWALGNPLRTYKPGGDPAFDEFSRLHQAIGWAPPDPTKDHMFGGRYDMNSGANHDPAKGGVKLTPKEEEDRMALYANKNGELGARTKSLADRIEYVMSGEDYANMSDTDQGVALSAEFHDALKDADERLLTMPEHKDLSDRVDKNQMAINDSHQLRPKARPVIKFGGAQ